jgi:hypothetical protein
MDIAYLILAHDQPGHLRALIRELSTPYSHFYIHIDAKSRMADFDVPDDPHVHVLQDRARVFWGDYSQVEAIVLLMRAALLQPGLAHSRFVLLSGADYPVRSNADIHHFFQEYAAEEFIQIERMPTADGCKTLDRLTGYQPRKTSFRVINRLKGLAQKVGLIAAKRDFIPALGDSLPYGGHTWWALTRPAVAHLLDFMDAHPAYVAFCRNTFCPDEHCFHTILGNSVFAPQVAPCLTYADWSRRSYRPENLTLAHAEFLSRDPRHPQTERFPEGLPYLFARKFTAESQPLAQLLQATLGNRVPIVADLSRSHSPASPPRSAAWPLAEPSES